MSKILDIGGSVQCSHTLHGRFSSCVTDFACCPSMTLGPPVKHSHTHSLSHTHTHTFTHSLALIFLCTSTTDALETLLSQDLLAEFFSLSLGLSFPLFLFLFLHLSLSPSLWSAVRCSSLRPTEGSIQAAISGIQPQKEAHSWAMHPAFPPHYTAPPPKHWLISMRTCV